MLPVILPRLPLARRFVLGLFGEHAEASSDGQEKVFDLAARRRRKLPARCSAGIFAMVPPTYARLSKRQQSVLNVLCRHAGNEDAWSGYVDQIAQESGLASRHVTSTLRELEAIAAIRVLRRHMHRSTFELLAESGIDLTETVRTETVRTETGQPFPKQSGPKESGTLKRRRNTLSKNTTCPPDGVPEAAPTDKSTTGRHVPRARARKEPSPADLAAWKILDAAFAEIVENVPDLGVTEKGWRQRNKSGALELVDRGRTPAEVAAMLLVAHRHPTAKRFWRHLNRLDKLAENWSRLAEINAATGTQSGNVRGLFPLVESE
jgi:hypothetical protein